MQERASGSLSSIRHDKPTRHAMVILYWKENQSPAGSSMSWSLFAGLGTAMSHTCYSAKAGQASPTEGQNGIRAALNLRLAAGLALLGLVLACASSPARAQQWTPQQRAACEPDAMRLCNQYVPDVQRVSACMSHYRRYLSPACRAVFQGGAKKRVRRFRR